LGGNDVHRQKEKNRVAEGRGGVLERRPLLAPFPSSMRMIFFFASLLLIAETAAGAPLAPPKSVFVDPFGDDVNGTGSLNDPFQTIARALQEPLARRSEMFTIRVSAGTWRGVWSNQTGSGIPAGSADNDAPAWLVADPDLDAPGPSISVVGSARDTTVVSCDPSPPFGGTPDPANATGVLSGVPVALSLKGFATVELRDLTIDRCWRALDVQGASPPYTETIDVNVADVLFLSVGWPGTPDRKFGMNATVGDSLSGPAIRVTGPGRPSVSIERTTFLATRAAGPNAFGGAVEVRNVDWLWIDFCTFLHNEAARSGGALRVQNTYVVDLTNVLISRAISLLNDGGGVYMQYVNDVLIDTVLVANSTSVSGSGGGVRLQDCTSTNVTGSVFAFNAALGNTAGVFGGGALFFQGQRGGLTISDCNFTYNTGRSRGGALYLLPYDKPVVIRNTRFEFNSLFTVTPVNPAVVGGGAVYLEGDATVSASSFISNVVAAGSGGGICARHRYVSPTVNVHSVVSVDDTVFANNRAPSAGGMRVWGDRLPAPTTTVPPAILLTNCRFEGNTATSATGALGGIACGALEIISEQSRLDNVTFIANDATVGSGALLVRDFQVASDPNKRYRTTVLNSLVQTSSGDRPAFFTLNKTLSVTRTTFDGNSQITDGRDAGALHERGRLIVDECVFSGGASIFGAGSVLLAQAAEATISRTTFQNIAATSAPAALVARSGAVLQLDCVVFEKVTVPTGPSLLDASAASVELRSVSVSESSFPLFSCAAQGDMAFTTAVNVSAPAQFANEMVLCGSCATTGVTCSAGVRDCRLENCIACSQQTCVVASTCEATATSGPIGGSTTIADSASASASDSSDPDTGWIIIVAVVAAVCICILVVIAIVVVLRRRKPSLEALSDTETYVALDAAESSQPSSSYTPLPVRGGESSGNGSPDDSAVAPPETPTLKKRWLLDFDDIEMGAELASGSFGVVYRGE
jgi:Right handed beta helix region